LALGTIAGGHAVLRGAGAALDDPARVGIARFYTAHVLPQATGHLAAVEGAATVFAFDADLL
jgi:hypothetical protein